LVVSLGCGDRLVGVDRYSTPPAALRDLPRVGDFLSPDLEAILRLQPDLIVLDRDQADSAAVLGETGIRLLALPMRRRLDVDSGLLVAGKVLGAEREAHTIVNTLQATTASYGSLGAALPHHPTALFVIDRKPGSLAGIVAAGPGSYADALLSLAGARNVVRPGLAEYPSLSQEDVLQLSPELVFEATSADSAREVQRLWDKLPLAPGTKRGVHRLSNPAFKGPTPGYPDALHELQPIILRAALDR